MRTMITAVLATAVFVSALAAESPSARLMSRADDAYELGDFATALDLYAQAQKADPAFNDVKRLLAFSEIDPAYAPPGSKLRTDPAEEKRLAKRASDLLAQYIQRGGRDEMAVRRYVDSLDLQRGLAFLDQQLAARPSDTFLLREVVRVAAPADAKRAVGAIQQLIELGKGDAEASYVAGVMSYEVVSKHKPSRQQADALIDLGLKASNRALQLKPDYFEALVYKSLLIREQAKLQSDAAKRDALNAEADRLKVQATDIMKKRRQH